MSERNRDSVRYENIYQTNDDVIPTVQSLHGSNEENVPIEYIGSSDFHSPSLESFDVPRTFVSPPDTIQSDQHHSNITSPSQPDSHQGRRTKQPSKKYHSGFFSSFSFSRSRDEAGGSARHGDGAIGDHQYEIAASASGEISSSAGSPQRAKSLLGAKKLTKKMSQAYLKQLKETSRSRFYDWSREELIELLVGAPFHYEIRNELHIQATALRDVADELYRDTELPQRPHLPTDFELTLFNVMARRIQDAWINYIITQRDRERTMRDMTFNDQVNLLRQSLEFGEVDAGEEGKFGLNDDLFFLSASREEVVADEEMGGGEILSPQELATIEQMFQQQEEEELHRQSSFEQGIEPGSGTALQQIVTTQPGVSSHGALVPEGLRRPPSALGISIPSPKPPSIMSGPPSSVRSRQRVNVFDIPWIAPDVNVAKNYANYVQPRKNRRKGKMYDFFKTTTGRYCCLDGFGEQFDMWEEGQVSEFAQYGSGVTNYFKFMKWLFWLFTILSVAALPMMVLNYLASQGNTENSGLKKLARTTLGNLALGTVNATLSVTIPGCSTNFLQPDTCTLSGPDLEFFYGMVEIAIAAIIMFAFLWLNYFQQFEEEELNQTLVKPSMYSIAVSHLPKDITEAALVRHFLRLLQTNDRSAIANVSLAYNNQIEIELSFQRGALMQEKIRAVHHYRKLCTTRRLSSDYQESKDDAFLQREKEKMLAKMKQINQDLSQKEKALEELANGEEDNQAIVAFITFDKAKDRDYILSLYDQVTFWQYCCASSALTISDQWIHVEEAPDPSVILWENLMFSRVERMKRRFVTTFSSLLCILLSLVMIFASKYVEEKAYNNGANKTTLCPSGFSSWTQDAQKNYVNQYPDTIHCYCDQESTLTQARDSFCQHYLSENISAQVLIYFASFMILLVNFLMETLIRRVSKWEKHHTNDGMGNSIFIRLFFLKYINTAAIFLINNNNVILRSLFGIQVSSAPEFTANWYDTVGVTIILVQLGDVINCHADTLWRYYQYSRVKAKALAQPQTALTQDELNQMLIGPKFDLAFNYAKLLTTLFVSLTFATGIPLLYPIAAVNFFIYYCIEKYFFIHMYKIPPHFNTTVGKRATLLIPMALGIHLGMSIWMLSNHKLFADTLTFTDDDQVRSQASGSLEQYYYASNSLTAHHDFANYTRKRVLQRATFPLLIAFAVVLVMWIGLIGFRHVRIAFDRFHNFWCKCSGPLPPAHRQRPNSPAAPRRNEKPTSPSAGNRRSDIEQGLLWSASRSKTAEPTRYLVTYTRAIQRNLIKGLATYNILQNPIYKEAFGITWKFAVDHRRVRSVRGLKLKALHPLAEDNIEQMEVSTRSHPDAATASPKKPRGLTLPPHITTNQEQKTVEIEQSTPRNRSFYSALLAGRPNTPNYTDQAPGSTPTAVTAAKTKDKKAKTPSTATSAARDSKQENPSQKSSSGKRQKSTTPSHSPRENASSSLPPVATSSGKSALQEIELSSSKRTKSDARPPSKKSPLTQVTYYEPSAPALPSNLPVVPMTRAIVLNNNNNDLPDDSTELTGERTISRFYPNQDDDLTAYSYDGISPRPVKSGPSSSKNAQKGLQPNFFPALYHKKDFELGSATSASMDEDDNNAWNKK